ncbi:MAG: hypothetical protein ACI8UO_003297 [Verrucomicrobiales bacterium]|jgi:hypothetical protein
MNAIAPQPSSEDEKLERELRDFEVVGPRPGLKERIRAEAAELGVESQDSKKIVRFPALQTWISSAAALVALAFGIALWMETEKPVEKAVPLGNRGLAGGDPTPAHRPYTLVDQVLVNQVNDGVIFTEDNQPMWQLRYDFINRAEWQDVETGETREVVAPEQRIFFMPVRHD